MPLYSKKRIKDGIVSLWHITEEFDELIELLPAAWLEPIDLQRVSKHNLAARALANTVCPEFDILEKDEYGKPFFESATRKISITHSGEFAGFMYKEREECGIDMEHLSERILKLAPKFVRHDEIQFQEHGKEGLYLIWCAKEAMYKYYGLKALDFKDHMKLDYTSIGQEGSMTGHISKGNYQKTIGLDYRFENGYLLVHTN